MHIPQISECMAYSSVRNAMNETRYLRFVLRSKGGSLTTLFFPQDLNENLAKSALSRLPSSSINRDKSNRASETDSDNSNISATTFYYIHLILNGILHLCNVME